MRKLVLLITATLMTTALAFAQSKQVTGTVVSDGGEPLAAVTVVIKGTQTGVYTDGNGDFTITAPSNATLVFSLTGQLNQEIYVGNQTHIPVTMITDVHVIKDVIVSGYGTAKKAGTVIGSVAVIDSEKFAVKPSMNVMDALQGQVAGLNIMTSSGQPNATPSIRLHGIGSIGGGTAKNEPLVILDGSAITLGTLMMMNQSDFESIVVLKDASATSIYGARAANGVIYVVSKSGRRDAGESAVVTVRTQYSMSSAVKPVLKRLDTDEYVDYMLEISEYLKSVGRPVIIDQETADEYKSYGNTNWYNEIFKKNAPMIQTDLSVAGGGRKTSYYVSGTYNDTRSVVRGADMKRYTFRTNLEVTPKEWLKTGMSLSTGYSSMSNIYKPSGVFPTAPSVGSLMIPSYQRTHDDDGNLYTELPLTGGYPSPLYMKDLIPNSQNRLQINGALFAEVKPVKGLTLRSNLGLNAFDYRSTSGIIPDRAQNSGSGSVGETFQRMYNWTLTNTAEYTHSFNREHTFSVLLGQETIFNDEEYFSVNMKGITDARYMFVSKGSELNGTPGHGISQSTFNSLFARADYNYKERYFVDASVRNDGSSRFGSNNRHATFYAVGAMWNLKNENFLKDNNTLSLLSLKASYGTQGNANIGDYSQYDLYGTVKYNGQMGWAPTSSGNADLKWEKQTKLTVGVNAELFSVVRLEIEYYNRKTSDMLMTIPNFSATGFSSRIVNVGGMKNTGVDVTINADLFKNKDWYINIGTTFNYNKNKVTELFGGQQEIAYGSTYLIVGEAFGTYNTYEWRGVNSETGQAQWTGEDGAIVNNFNEAVLVNTKKSIYSPYVGGVSFVASWKGLALSADMSWQAGRWMLNNTLWFTENTNFMNSFGQTEGALDYWKKPGDKTRYPSLEAQYNGSKQFDTHMIENASFIRLKNIQLSYTLPRKIVQKTRVFEGIKVWVGARNLLTWTNFRGLDPEVDNSVALDNYPNTRQITFGLEVQF